MGKKLTKVQYDTSNTETTLNNLIGALVDVRESLLYWKHEAMSRTKVTQCQNCIWHYDGYCDQLERSTEDDFWCKSGLKKNETFTLSDG